MLLTQAFELSRGGGDRRGVDALFAQVQAMQVERNSLRKQIGQVLGTQRLHEAAEVWKLGVYDYRRVVGGDPPSARTIEPATKTRKGPKAIKATIAMKTSSARMAMSVEDRWARWRFWDLGGVSATVSR